MANIKNVNKVLFIGRLGADPELRYTKNGTAVTTISLATSKSHKNRETDEWEETTQWHRVVLWKGLAEFAAAKLSKGSAVYIEGELRYRKWEDEEGNPRKAAEVHASVCNLLADGRAEEGSESVDDEEIPF